MLSPQVIFKGLVARALGTPPTIDGNEQERVARLGRYGDVKVESSWPTDHMQSDEGGAYLATMLPGATVLQLGLSAAFSATAAPIVIQNTDAPSAAARRLYLKAIRMAVSVAPTSGTSLQYAVVIDNQNRTPSTVSNGSGGTGPGTPATITAYKVPITNPNGDVNTGPAAVVWFPLSTAAGAPPTVPAPSGFARTIVGNGIIKGSIPVALDQYRIQFGCADIGGTFQGAAALAKIVEHAPAVIVGPGQFALLYLWAPGNITAGLAFSDLAIEWAEK